MSVRIDLARHSTCLCDYRPFVTITVTEKCFPDLIVLPMQALRESALYSCVLLEPSLSHFSFFVFYFTIWTPPDNQRVRISQCPA
jgi:hypothetical protein